MKAMKTKTLKWVNICNNFLYSYKNKKDFAVKSNSKNVLLRFGSATLHIYIYYLYLKKEWKRNSLK